jgi:hypothetical protein
MLRDGRIGRPQTLGNFVPVGVAGGFSTCQIDARPLNRCDSERQAGGESRRRSLLRQWPADECPRSADPSRHFLQFLDRRSHAPEEAWYLFEACHHQDGRSDLQALQ